MRGETKPFPNPAGKNELNEYDRELFKAAKGLPLNTPLTIERISKITGLSKARVDSLLNRLSRHDAVSRSGNKRIGSFIIEKIPDEDSSGH